MTWTLAVILFATHLLAFSMGIHLATSFFRREVRAMKKDLEDRLYLRSQHNED